MHKLPKQSEQLRVVPFGMCYIKIDNGRCSI